MHNNQRETDKPANFFGSIKDLLNYSKKYVPYVIIALILSMLSSIFTIIGPDKLGEITNIIMEGVRTSIDLDSIKGIAIFLIVLYVLSLIFGYVMGLIMNKISQKISFNLRHDITEKINRLPLKYFDNTTYGDVLSRVTNDVDMIATSLNQSFGTLISSVTMIIGSLFMMIRLSGVMTITAVLSTIIGFVFMIVIMKRSQKYFNANQKTLGGLNGYIEQIYSGHTIVKVYNADEEAKVEFDKLNKELEYNSRRSSFLSGLMMPIMSFIGNLGYVSVCVVGSILVAQGEIEFGIIVSFILYVRQFTRPLAQLAQVAQSFQSAASASERVFKFLREEELPIEENKRILNKEEVKGNIEFKNVKFGYTDKIIIDNFNLSVNSGEKIAIVGPTGAGKTTLVNLLMKFYEINSGTIKIDGVDINDLTRENIHDLFCMVLQDTWIFDGTAYENLVYNNEATKEEVEHACEIVGLDHYINTLPESYDSKLVEGSISAGEKQLLTIVRGMLKEAPLLILDEATSSVDTRTEKLVNNAMEKLTEGKTSFIIAHRLSTIREANKILVMNEGNIVEIGNHSELMDKKGFYYDLYQAQFEN